ncbi:hypothetical protein [Actinoallomurus soli]|uniref:hypothetical protein n=1 Tax=Actinoallomurus soli TaxID=2952535 RepID=UPI0020934F82|nr:hypothetical protein [Actinoallomurus soli]MCO5968970.1 hypothetical protein [Actinoallomurus soli]
MSQNPLKDPHKNLQRLSDVKDSVPKYREQLPPCSYKFIAGDFVGLRHLSDDLYWFAWQCDHEVKALADHVEKLIGDGGSWDSDTAIVFRNTFGQDAILTNGFAREICEIAKVIDQLGLRLAKLEFVIEQALQRGLSKGYLQWTQSTTEANSGLIALSNPAGGFVIAKPGDNAAAPKYAAGLRQLYTKSLDQAERIRKNATTELATLCAPLSKALTWYLKKDEYDSGGLLAPSQIEKDSAEVDKLQKAYANSVKHLSASDFSSAVDDAKKIGSDVKTISDIVGGIKGLKGADLAKGIGTAGDNVSKVGSVITDILLLLAVAPK